MHYLFGFDGRINRLKIWLFFVITGVWEIVLGVVAIFGLHWNNYLHALAKSLKYHPLEPAPVPWPDPLSGDDWIAIGVMAFLLLVYFIVFLAVYAKRLHDRDKSAWWLILFIITPWSLDAFAFSTGPMQTILTGLTGDPLGIARAAACLTAIAISLWAFVELYVLSGTEGENRFGPDPLYPVEN